MNVDSARTPLVLALDTLWAFAAVALFVQLFGQGDGQAPSVIAVAAVIGGSHLLSGVTRPADDDAPAPDPTFGVVATLLALATIVTLTYALAQPDFGWLSRLIEHPRASLEANTHVAAAALALAALWIWGVWRGPAPDAGFDRVLTTATLGLFAAVIAAASEPQVQGGVSWELLAFAYGALMLIALAALRAPDGVSVTAVAGRWSLVVGALAASSLVLAFAAGAFGGELTDALSAPFQTAGNILLDYVLAPIIWLIALPARAFFALLETLGFGDGREQMLQPPEEQPEREQTDDEGQPLWFRVLAGIATGAGILALAALAVALLVRALRRALSRRKRDGRDEYEAVEPGSLITDLASMFGALGRPFQRRSRGAASAPIRRLYARMLETAAERGLERPAAATPLQFAPRLDTHFASGVPSEITAEFVDSRYGERPVDPARVRELDDRFRETVSRPDG